MAKTKMGKFVNSGQHLTELAIVFSMIMAVTLALRVYVQRSLQARYKAGVDYSLSSLGLSKTQYDPYYRTAETIENRTMTSTIGSRDNIIDQSTNRFVQEWTSSSDDAD
ncbi:MAG: hypothetical protein ABIH27_01565 [Candidatus Omnitrophota bacterium]